MTIAIDLDTHLASNLTALGEQGVANTNNFAHYANLAFTKDRLWAPDRFQVDFPLRAVGLNSGRHLGANRSTFLSAECRLVGG